MNYDDWTNDTLEKRREAISSTIRPATMQELEELGVKSFPIVTDPWFDRYQNFLKKHSDLKFYRAQSPEGAEVVYCRESNEGVWFLQGTGMGILQPKGLQMLAEIVDAL
jgi:hypothetical protein